jgi:hypothetical protein
VLDAASRRILGFALGEHHDAELAYSALVMAVAVRGGHVPGVVMHTDQGSEYTAAAFRAACERLGICQSMGRVGSALDNAVIESWHSTVEFELRRIEHFATRAQARARVAAWIEEYNTARRHSSCGMMPPVAWELAAAQACGHMRRRRPRERGRPLRGPRQEGGGFAAAHIQEGCRARAGGTRRAKGTRPPLSVKAGCDRRTTANREAAWRMYTPSPALSAEPPAAPRGRKSGQAPACPHPARGASDDHRTRAPADARSIKVNWRSIVRKRTEITRIH